MRVTEVFIRMCQRGKREPRDRVIHGETYGHKQITLQRQKGFKGRKKYVHKINLIFVTSAEQSRI